MNTSINPNKIHSKHIYTYWIWLKRCRILLFLCSCCLWAGPSQLNSMGREKWEHICSLNGEGQVLDDVFSRCHLRIPITQN